MISVICAVYNTEKYINASIDSILNQTYKDFEIIVIDDGSSDSSVMRMEKYIVLPNFRLVKKSHTGNVGRILNDCMKLASGEYIAIMSADDIWLPDKLEIQMSYINNYDMICSNSYIMYEENKVFSELFTFKISSLFRKKENFRYDKLVINEFDKDVDLYLKDLLICNYIVTISVLIKKKAMVDAGGFDEDIGIRGEDYILWVNFSKSGIIKYINKPLVKYRIHNDNLSFSSYNERVQLLYRFIEIRSDFLSSLDKSISDAAKKGCAAMYHELGKLSVKNKRYFEAKNYWLRFLKLYDRKLSISFIKYLFYLFGIAALSLFNREN